MKLTNVSLILGREIRDQLRDRRTLFMIAVLPILLYPLMGMSFFQLSQFMQQKPTTVLIVGETDFEDLPGLVADSYFEADLFVSPQDQQLLEVFTESTNLPENVKPADDPRQEALKAVQSGRYDAALYFPPDFAQRLDKFRQVLKRQMGASTDDPVAAEQTLFAVPSPEILYNTASEKSQITFFRLARVVERWREKVVEQNLADTGVPATAAKPFSLDTSDVAEETGMMGAGRWAKILPMLLVLWAMTGAFYPAVDLCAGEKERGTLETLLSSPAGRSEIVLGKLLTVMLFSVVTALLNLASLGITGWAVLAQIPQIEGFGMPSVMSIVWLVVALLPISALFSALCLALAALARSTKEGQYYLMPLMLVTMPLAILPMAPGVEMTLGNSLIPVTGVVLLLRSLLAGNYLEALQYSPVVIGVTLAACAVSIRWAVDQFNSEKVLFRESERFDLGLWIRHLVTDRQPTPTVATAVFCGALILMIRFFLSLAFAPPDDFGDFAFTAIATQVVVILAPALLMTLAFTGSPRDTLQLKRFPVMALPAAALLALVLHPFMRVLQSAVTELYPLDERSLPALKHLETMLSDAPVWQLLILIAVLPAICEELAFRGFILSGFRHLGHRWRAIVYTAVLFGFTHAILQQSMIAALVGVVIGFVAVQSGSIFPAMAYHLVHNALTVTATRIPAGVIERWPALDVFLSPGEGGTVTFDWPAFVVAGVLATAVLWWFGRLRYRMSEEERLQQAILEAGRQAGRSLAA